MLVGAIAGVHLCDSLLTLKVLRGLRMGDPHGGASPDLSVELNSVIGLLDAFRGLSTNPSARPNPRAFVIAGVCTGSSAFAQQH